MASKFRHPYSQLPEKKHWLRAVANKHFSEISELWEPFNLTKKDSIATAGSCFAQHLGRNLKERGAHFLNMEPAPSFLSDAAKAKKWGFGVFSCRYGNIYTVRQLLQLFDEAFGERMPSEPVWERDGRFFDSLRPNIDPVGSDDAETVVELRIRHLEKVREMFINLDVFVFTLGLTETWESLEDGTVFPVAPGVVAGNYCEEKYRFRNFKYPEILKDLQDFFAKLRHVNGSARMLLTVSPVPLMATASSDHVVVATTYSKSTLRAVAGDFVESTDSVYYFPSYEIIMSPQSRGVAFDPDQRSVNQYGVNLVMENFFAGQIGSEFSISSPVSEEGEGLICDEELLEDF